MTQNIFDYVLERVSITALISQYTELKTRGRNTTGLCPFHSEKTPSFSVSEEKGLYHCFGCQKSGNALTFVCEKENLDRYDGIRHLADRFGIDVSAFDRPTERIDRDEKKKMHEVLRYAAVFYRRNLASSERAKGYLAQRGVDDATAQKYGIGYAPESWDALYQVFRKRYTDEQLLAAGVISKSERGTYDRFRNRLMFPIVDQRNRIVGFGGRVFGDDKPKYLNSPESSVFQKGELLYGLNIAKDHLGTDRQIIVTEGYMDVVGLARHGIMNAVATLGTALTPEHAKLLARYSQNVVLCYDADAAGRAAALKGIDVLSAHIPTLRVAELDDGLDPDDFVSRYGAEAFGSRLSNAQRALEYKIEQLAFAHTMDDPHEKAQFLQKATEWIKTLNPFEKENYIVFLSERYDVDPLLIRRQVGNIGVSSGRTPPHKPVPPPPRAEERLLRSTEFELIAEFAHHFRALSTETILTIVQGEYRAAVQERLKDIMTYYCENPEAATMDFARFADQVGLEKAKQLEQICAQFPARPDRDIDRTMLRYRLAWLDAELLKPDIKMQPELVQRCLTEKKTLIDILKSNNRKGATRFGK